MTKLNSRSFWLLFIVAAISFIPAIGFYYVGEEAIFPISSMEMWQHGVWLKQYMYGLDVQHNPLFNWLIMPFSALAGWEHVLTVTRVLTIAATLLTALVLAWLAFRLFGDKAFAAFSALAYLTMADVLLYHGWLGYVDPLFALCIFTAISALWLDVQAQKPGLLFVAALSLTAAFLSKAFTAYVFYGAALFVLLFDPRSRNFLLRWPSVLAHVLMFSAPLVWFRLIPSGHAQSGRMFAEILHKLSDFNLGAYLVRLGAFPLETLLWLSPLPLLALYYWIRKRSPAEDGESQRLFRLACWIALLNFLPYWLSPQGGMRYLMPIYPLFALIAARVIWRAGEVAMLNARNWVVGVLVLKFILVLFAFPYYQNHYRGKNYKDAADEIVVLTQGQALYITDVSSAGLNVAAYINQQRYPAAALQWPPGQWVSGFVLSRSEDAALGTRVRKYQLAGDEMYLLCRGAACARP